MNHRLVRVGATALALCAACATGAQAAPQAHPSATKSPILVGQVVDTSGPLSPNLAGFAAGTQAWAAAVNAHGGIAGHPVKLFTADGKSTTVGTLTATKQLIEQRKVAAFFVSADAASISKYVQQKGVPQVGGINSDITWFTNPYFFPSGTTPDKIVLGIVSSGVRLGAKKVGNVLCVEAAACAPTQPLIESAAKQAGGEFVWSQNTSASAPDYTSTCLAARSKGVQTFFMGVGGTTAIRIAENCASNGYKPRYVYASTILTPAMAKSKALDGSFVTYSNLPLFVRTPATNEFLAALNKYKPGFTKSALYNQQTLQGWISGKLVEAALKKAKIGNGPVTKPDVLRGLYKLKGETLGDLAPPLSYKRGKPTSIPCYFVATIKGDKFTSYQKKPKAVCPS